MVRNNIKKTDMIVKAVWAIYHHMIIGPPEESVEKQHFYCPDSGDSWCHFKLFGGKMFTICYLGVPKVLHSESQYLGEFIMPALAIRRN